MSDHHAAAGEVANQRLAEPHADDTAERRSVLATAWSAVTALVGGIMGLLPHLLHHVGLLGGAVLVTGATGNVVFAVLGLVLSLPLLRRLYRRFGTWKAPALALAVFALMFSLSAFVIGPAINNDNPSPDRPPAQTPGPDDHEGHHGG
jgi:VIT1/CCC1 family predicted Fe2+/Mn2+ transporter